MTVLHSLEALANWQKKMNWEERKSSFVPTMGSLHEGHASLIAQAAASSDLVLVSILVNPTQFTDASDYEKYPRNLEADAEKAAQAGAHAVFAPSPEELYGGTPSSETVQWGALTHSYEGAKRKGHFDGVVAVVDLLFQTTKPDVAVFGEKDLQQVGVVRRLAQERHPSIAIQVGELVRDENGLALSSRNARLNEEGLETALALSRALFELRQSHGEGKDWTGVLEKARAALSAHPAVDLEYLDVVDADTFEPWQGIPNQRAYGIVAAQVQGVRLIDNAQLMA